MKKLDIKASNNKFVFENDVKVNEINMEGNNT